MLKLSEFSHNYCPSGVKFRRGISVVAKAPTTVAKFCAELRMTELLGLSF